MLQFKKLQFYNTYYYIFYNNSRDQQKSRDQSPDSPECLFLIIQVKND